MNPKYKNAKCFLRVPGGYEEITYEELCRRADADPMYFTRKFIPLHGMLMEVTESDYAEFFRDERRQKYLTECSVRNGDVSLDGLDDEDHDTESFLTMEEDVVGKQIAFNKLRQAISCLIESEQQLIYSLYFGSMSEREYADASGFSRSAVHKRKLKILKRLKSLMEK